LAPPVQLGIAALDYNRSDSPCHCEMPIIRSSIQNFDGLLRENAEELSSASGT
jgi:hypothetical protein